MNDELLARHPLFTLLAAVGSRAAAAGYRTAVVGGFVRDLLLGIISRDIDIAVEGDAIACAHHLAASMDGAVTKTSRFGTAVLMAGGTRIDLAMARTERYSRPGALPDVSPGTLAEDLWRRDFTVNAIAVELSPDSAGRLLDPTGGRTDLAARAINVLHPASFRDDPTRMLRAVRLAHRLGFSLAAATAELLRAAVRERCWLTVGAYRLGQEIRLLFQEQDPSGLCSSLDAWGLFRPLFRCRPDAAMLASLARLGAAGEWLARSGRAFDPAATAAFIVGGRAARLLDPGGSLRGWAARLPDIRRTLAAPSSKMPPTGAVPPPVLAYLWIMCQNEEERARLENSLPCH
jgi:tRNA nucleotidyltransferase/poly(A) polymerase